MKTYQLTLLVLLGCVLCYVVGYVSGELNGKELGRQEAGLQQSKEKEHMIGFDKGLAAGLVLGKTEAFYIIATSKANELIDAMEKQNQ